MECVHLTEGTERCRAGVLYAKVTAIRSNRLIMPCTEDEAAPSCPLDRYRAIQR